MSKKIVVPIVVFAMCCVGAFLLVATAPSVQQVPPDRAITVVRTMSATPRNVRLTVRSQGTVAPRSESGLVPEVSGRIVWMSPALVSGGFFGEDELLLRIDPLDYEMALTRSRAALLRADSEVEFANSELARQRGLSERNIASSADLSAAILASKVAQAGLAEAQVGLELAKRDLERTELRAPYRGRVRQESVDVGQFVSRGATIATLYATDYAEIRLPIPDGQLAYLDLPGLHGSALGEGPRVLLRAHFAGEQHEWEGRIVRTEGEIDPRSRMVHVVARVENPYAMSEELIERGDALTLAVRPEIVRPPLVVGLFVKAEIEGPIVEDVIVVPRYAMTDDSHLLVVDGDDRLRTREVEVLRIDRDDVLIRGALAPRERICVSSIQVMVEGMRVRPIDDTATPKVGGV